MLTYSEALRMLKSRASKKIANNTCLVRLEDGTIAVRLHSTDVVVLHADGAYTLQSGGFKNATTKARLNRFSPAKVFQQAYRWYIGSKENEFRDGMIVDASGKELSLF
jgi:hypothetical protein